jgi:hypothetical protein
LNPPIIIFKLIVVILVNDFPAEVVLHVVFEIVGEAGDGLQFVERRPEVVPDCATSKSAKPVRSP